MCACSTLPGCRNEAELKQWFLDTGTASTKLWVLPGEFYSVLSPAALHFPSATFQPSHGSSCSSCVDNSTINPCIFKSNSAGGNSRFQRSFPKFIWIQLGGRIVICQGLGALCFTPALQVRGAGFVLWQVSWAELQLGSISHSCIWQNQVGISTEYFSVAFRSKWAHKAWRSSSCAATVQESAKRREQQRVWTSTDTKSDLNPHKNSFSNK